MVRSAMYYGNVSSSMSYFRWFGTRPDVALRNESQHRVGSLPLCLVTKERCAEDRELIDATPDFLCLNQRRKLLNDALPQLVVVMWQSAKGCLCGQESILRDAVG
jgi:hypothetical protein